MVKISNGSVIVQDGKKILLNRGYKGSPDYTAPSVFKVGYAGATPDVADTDLDNTYPISNTEAVDACDATTGWAATTDGSVSLNTTAGQYKEGTGALNLIKSGGTQTSVTYSKTTTSLDFTDKEFFLWFYIDDKTDLKTSANAVEVRFGSDASNYYQEELTPAELSNGWNLVRFTSATADSTTGSPTIAACDYTAVVLYFDNAADTIAAPDARIDDIKIASAGDFTKTVVSGYPTFDEPNNEVTMQCFLSSVEANGQNLDSVGLFNTDGTALMHSKDVHTDESKTTSDEFTYTFVDRIE